MVKGFLRKVRRLLTNQVNSRKSTKEVFTEIYLNGLWGGKNGEFSSGTGSRLESLVSPYIDMVSRLSYSEGFYQSRFVDLGCGDFSVGRQLLPFCSSYIGVDIVTPLVEAHQRDFGNMTTSFICLDIIDDMLPDGDVCFIRQVLQHLSNDQINAILHKLTKYKSILITEHYPDDDKLIVKNIDKVQGDDARARLGSGVYLQDPPFNLPPEELTEVLAVPLIVNGTSWGVIRTYLYKPTT